MAGHSTSSGAMRRKGSKGKDPFGGHDLKVRGRWCLYLRPRSFPFPLKVNS